MVLLAYELQITKAMEGQRAQLTRVLCACADIVPQQVTIASLLQQVQREDALDLANGALPILKSYLCVNPSGQGACAVASHAAA